LKVKKPAKKQIKKPVKRKKRDENDDNQLPNQQDEMHEESIAGRIKRRKKEPPDLAEKRAKTFLLLQTLVNQTVISSQLTTVGFD
jgi:hypothetical protein